MLWNTKWFPGTNLQDINLDWILKKISALRGGRTGQYLYKKSDKDFDFGWKTGGGGGGTSDYLDLDNKPSINNVELVGNKNAADLGLAASSDIPEIPVQSVNGKTGVVVLSASDVGAYVKPATGIPKTDLSSAVQTSLDKADTAYTKPESGIPKTDLSNAVQTSLNKADTALQAVPPTYRTAAAQDTIDAAQDAKIETIAGSLAMIESSPATTAHVVGEYIVYNGQLYKVTAAIAAGQTLTIGTNIEASNIINAVNSLEQFSATYNQDYVAEGANVYCNRIGKICFINGNFDLSQNIPIWTDVNLLTMSVNSAIRVYSYAFGNSTVLRSLQFDSNSNIVKLRSLNSAITTEGFRFGAVFISQ